MKLPYLSRKRRAQRRQAAADYLGYDGPERRASPRRKSPWWWPESTPE
ncbi:MAG: hypothetical protein M4D85_01200 [Actinomycetota bacterium]|nr:hypothetical protein [Actinomycetota bacterium]